MREQHAKSMPHKTALVGVLRGVGLPTLDNGLIDRMAPSLHDITVTARRIKEGRAPAGCGHKFTKIAYCLAQVLFGRDRSAIRTAEVMGIFRDDRQNHMAASGNVILNKPSASGLRLVCANSLGGEFPAGGSA